MAESLGRRVEAAGGAALVVDYGNPWPAEDSLRRASAGGPCCCMLGIAVWAQRQRAEGIGRSCLGRGAASPVVLKAVHQPGVGGQRQGELFQSHSASRICVRSEI